jgi:hypothetical protein
MTGQMTPKQANLMQVAKKALSYTPIFNIEFRDGFIEGLDEADLLAAEIELNAIQAAADALSAAAKSFATDDPVDEGDGAE